MAKPPEEQVIDNLREGVAAGNIPAKYLEKAEFMLAQAKAEAYEKGLPVSQCLKPLVEGNQVYVFPQWSRMIQHDPATRTGRTDVIYEPPRQSPKPVDDDSMSDVD